MVRGASRQVEEENNTGTDHDHLGPEAENVQLSRVEGLEDSIQEVSIQVVFQKKY